MFACKAVVKTLGFASVELFTRIQYIFNSTYGCIK